MRSGAADFHGELDRASQRQHFECNAAADDDAVVGSTGAVQACNGGGSEGKQDEGD